MVEKGMRRIGKGGRLEGMKTYRIGEVSRD